MNKMLKSVSEIAAWDRWGHGEKKKPEQTYSLLRREYRLGL